LSRKADLAGEVFNVGTKQPHSVREVVEKVFEVTEQHEKYAEIERLWPHKKTTGEIDCQYMTFDKANKLFGWKPETDFDSGIRLTVDWYRKYFSAKKK
jgi:CDP-glucose 4,6-dehydratase